MPLRMLNGVLKTLPGTHLENILMMLAIDLRLYQVLSSNLNYFLWCYGEFLVRFTSGIICPFLGQTKANFSEAGKKANILIEN